MCVNACVCDVHIHHWERTGRTQSIQQYLSFVVKYRGFVIKCVCSLKQCCSSQFIARRHEKVTFPTRHPDFANQATSAVAKVKGRTCQAIPPSTAAGRVSQRCLLLLESFTLNPFPQNTYQHAEQLKFQEIQFVKPDLDILKITNHSYRESSRKCLLLTRLIKQKGRKELRGEGGERLLVEIITGKPGKQNLFLFCFSIGKPVPQHINQRDLIGAPRLNCSKLLLRMLCNNKN